MLDTTPQTNIAAASIMDKNQVAKKSGAETELAPNEMFFSRTDDRGVIQSGNSVFQRISGFEWSELVGAPHKIVRHEDMPKAVYQVFWDALKEGKPVVAYVKNKTKDGGFYWVAAFISSIKGGYLSVRIKPQTKLFDIVRAEYPALCLGEMQDGLDAKASSEKLLERLLEMGYGSYDSLAAAIASQEYDALNKSQNRKSNPAIATLVEVQKALQDIRRASRNVAQACDNVDVLPTNLQIQSSRFGAVAAPIGIIAKDCGERTQNLALQMVELESASRNATSSVNSAILKVCATEIQVTMLASFLDQTESASEVDFNDEVARLMTQNKQNTTDLGTILKDVQTQVTKCSAAANAIDRQVVALHVTRSMCNIESSFIGQHASTIQNIVDQLADFQSEVSDPLRIIKSNVNLARENAQRLQQEGITISGN